MKVLLISSNVSNTPYPVYPLGLSMVAAALQSARHKVYQFDLLQNNGSLDTLADEIRQIDPDIIGISIRNIDNVNLLNEQRYINVDSSVVQKIRGQTDAPVVLGGSGFSIMPEVILREVGADYGIVGEGESLMVDFVANAGRGVYPEERCIRASFKLSGKKIPSACYDDRLMEFYLKSGNMASIQTKRGCIHNCVYCCYPLLEGSTIRPRDPQAVVDDIEMLVDRHQVRYIFFTDSVFNDDQQHYLAVVREMKKRGVYVSWTAFFKPQGLDDESVALMKQTGLKAAEIGSDGPTDTTLRGLGKSFRFKDILDCNDLFVSHGVATAHYYMFGCPGETRETVLEGIENIKNLKKTVSFIFMGIRILPDTVLARIACRQGFISHDQALLDSVYYIAPGIDRQWLEKTLTDAFSGIRHCVFPPDALDSSLQFLHKLGYSGSLWDMLIPGGEKRQRQRRYATK
ncbi:MAG: lipid biosynthesis B12-binding/radical SAM protein [Desulfobacterales bacterium]|nr:lipid biosynthesis B12-binding/radical SAM protein [Desulfobacterales bacterium]